jgi:uncharacterized membrane protein YhdT
VSAPEPSDATDPTPGTSPDRAPRRSAAPWAKVGMVLFAIGLLAIVADLVLFATGSRNLPVWLNATCMLAPVGLGVALIGVLREARTNGRARATRVSRDTPAA